MIIFSHLGLKTKVELALAIIVLILLIMLVAIFIITAVIRETNVVGACKKVVYGLGYEGECGKDYYVVSVMDNDGILRNPDAAPTSGYMICCRAEK